MANTQEGFCPIEEALAELRAGRMIVLVDDENRENEGDLVVAAEKVTPEAINFMMRNACGLVCLSMSAELCDRLHLDPLPGHNVDPMATPFTPYIDARTGITTGTSAHDRARTVQVAVADEATPNDLVRGKGHVPGLRAREGGVLVRAGHTEGSVDLTRLAGLKEAAAAAPGERDRSPVLTIFSSIVAIPARRVKRTTIRGEKHQARDCETERWSPGGAAHGVPPLE